MYFLSDEDRRMLLRRYLPQTREAPISDELRGWNWAAAPLSRSTARHSESRRSRGATA